MSRILLPNGQNIADVGGGVQNPMNKDLDAAGFKIFGINTVAGIAGANMIVEVPVGFSIIFKRPA